MLVIEESEFPVIINRYTHSIGKNLVISNGFQNTFKLN